MAQTALAAVLAAAVAGAAPGQPAAPLEIPSALVKVIEQVDVPAKEAGVLAAVKVREGQMVEKGELLAQIVDTEACIARDRAKIELEIAKKKAKNDVNIRFAKKSAEVAKAELRRSMESYKIYPKSISDSEMDRLRLVVQRAELEVEQAEYEFEIAELAWRVKENEYQAAEEKVQRRKINAPLRGVVVDVHRRGGEWMELGETVLRVLRIDRLRAEGFLRAEDVRGDLVGAPVRLRVDLPNKGGAEFPGKIVFLSPEIDPVNAQIRVWAEVDNRRLKLRPGMRAKIIVEPPTTDSTRSGEKEK